MKQWKSRIFIAVICFAVGFAVVLQIRSVQVNQPKPVTSPPVENTEAQRAETISLELKTEKEKNAALSEELEKTKAELVDMQKGATGKDEAAKKLAADYDNMAQKAGYTSVSGKGVTVTLKDKPTQEGGNANVGIVHDQDVLKVVNELRAAGAQAISINGERLIAISEIRCVGNTICVNRNVYGAPFVITAIGDAKTLESGLNLPGGAVESLSYYINITVEKGEKLTVPAYKQR